MMFKDVIDLIVTGEAPDGGGGYETVETSRNQVFADRKSVKQNEFYLAQQAGLEAQVIFRLNALDYNDERLIEYNNDFYSVIRTYEDVDYIELTCQKRIGGLDDVLNG